MQMELFVLRIAHIVGGVFWVGGITLMAFFVFPSVRDAGPAGGPVMAGLAQRKLMTLMPVVAIVTILTGLRLLMRASSGAPGWYSTPSGMMYSMSGGLAILIFLHALAVARPKSMRMLEVSKLLAAPDADREKLGAEMKALQAKVAFNFRLTATMLLVATVGMAIARYI